MRGMVTLTYEYDDPYKMDPTMIYIPSMRRIRKMSSTDTQDPRGDMTYDDANFLSQKISPERFPYKFEIIEEREYLLPFSYGSANAWVDPNNGYAFRNVPFMRRPAYVLQMTALDPNYCYSKRIYYLDKETSQPSWAEFYDQKGRLYRDYFVPFVFMPKSGQVTSYGQPNCQVDYIDLHSTLQPVTYVPVKFKRNDLTIQHLIKEGK
jgi:hypothetical protein